jgi:hypothetical protein
VAAGMPGTARCPSGDLLERDYDERGDERRDGDGR